jgi:hypothetical protein
MNMNMQFTKRFWLTVLPILFQIAMADNRSYVWTYAYQTLDAGEAEVEHYLTFSSPDVDSLETTTSTEFNLELEVGMTDRFDFALYQVLEQPPAGVLRYSGYKLRWRYRFGEKGRYFMDPLLYLEYKGTPNFASHELEGKVILAKDFGRWNLALNPIWELEIDDGDAEQVWKYAAGVSYTVNDLLRVGLESFGGVDGYYLGPVIAHGVDDLWMTIGSGFAVGSVKDGRPEFMIRLLVGIGVQ